MNTDEMLRVQDAVLILRLRVSRPKLTILQREAHARGRVSGWSSMTMEGSVQRSAVAHLSSGVDDLCRKLLTLMLDNFAESVLDGWIITLNKMTIDELDGQGRLP